MEKAKGRALAAFMAFALAFALLGIPGAEALAATMSSLKLVPVNSGNGAVVEWVYGVYDGGYALVLEEVPVGDGDTQDFTYHQRMVNEDGVIVDYGTKRWRTPTSGQKIMEFWEDGFYRTKRGLMDFSGVVLAEGYCDFERGGSYHNPEYYVGAKVDDSGNATLSYFDQSGVLKYSSPNVVKVPSGFIPAEDAPDSPSSPYANIYLASSGNELYADLRVMNPNYYEEGSPGERERSLDYYFKIGVKSFEPVSMTESQWQALKRSDVLWEGEPYTLKLPNGVVALSSIYIGGSWVKGPVDSAGRKIPIGSYQLSGGSRSGEGDGVFGRPELNLYYVTDGEGRYGVCRFDGTVVVPVELEGLYDMGRPGGSSILVKSGGVWNYLDLSDLGEKTPKPVSGGEWKKDSHGWWYAYAAGGYAKGKWENIDRQWYLFDGAGYMRTGWAKVSGSWYYLKSSGAMATGWQKVGGSWYYLKSSGAMATGWQKVGGSWYYLKSSGAMASGQWVGNYYLKSDGSMATSTWIGKYHVGADGKWDRTR